jgi:hypothetical protein
MLVCAVLALLAATTVSDVAAWLAGAGVVVHAADYIFLGSAIVMLNCTQTGQLTARSS